MVKLENMLKPLMMQSVQFQIDGKTIKRGKIRIFNTKQFFIRFKLEDDENTIKEFELPYPYRIDKIPNGLLFDYCLSAFVPKTEEVHWKMRTLNTENASKIHEKYLMVITT